MHNWTLGEETKQNFINEPEGELRFTVAVYGQERGFPPSIDSRHAQNAIQLLDNRMVFRPRPSLTIVNMQFRAIRQKSDKSFTDYIPYCRTIFIYPW